jgi:hypothetical protein
MASTIAAVYGLYAAPDAAQRAYTALVRAGVAERDITVVSAEPFEAFEFSQRDHSLLLFRLAAVGGLVGFIGAVSLVAGTELAWPIDVGGMPIVAWWPNLVIIFELTMLSAILTTVVSLLITGGMPSRVAGALYDPEVSDGRILVGVPLTGGRVADDIKRALDSAEPLAVKNGSFRA